MEDKGSNRKSNLPSRYVSVGPKSAPHRSYYYAMGLKEHEIYQPFVGVVSTWNESAPCNITLQDQAQHVKTGVKDAGGTPRTLVPAHGVLQHVCPLSRSPAKQVFGIFLVLKFLIHKMFW